MSTWTEALVLAVARGIRGAGWVGAGAGGAPAGGCCAWAADAPVKKTTARKRETLIENPSPSFRGNGKSSLKVSFLHLGKELLRFFLRLDSCFIGRIVRQILVVLFSESLGHLRVRAALGSILFGKRQKFAVVHDWFRRTGL